MAKKRIAKLSGADARYGWRFGCDGFVSAREAARMLGRSHSRVSRWLSDEGRKKPGHIAYPLRGRKDEQAGIPNAPWEVCVRSINEWNQLHEPVEV